MTPKTYSKSFHRIQHKLFHKELRIEDKGKKMGVEWIIGNEK